MITTTTAAAMAVAGATVADYLPDELKGANGEVFGSEVSVFSPYELEQLTDNYSQDNFLGDTKFAKLYRGKKETHAVTVKIFIDSSSTSGPDSPMKDKHSRFKDEIHLLQHPSIRGRQRNLAKLIGYCPESLGVVYDSNPRDTLDNLILDDNFTWIQRMKVALQLARLHVFFHDYDPPFILCNTDPARIMVDQDCDLVLFDFGMLVGGFLGNSREIPKGKLNEGCSYLDLEFLMLGGWSTAHDVFTYGVLLLSLISKRLLDICWSETSVARWAKKDCKEKVPRPELENDSDMHKIFKKDPDYDVHDANKIMKLSMGCIELLPKDRPTMKEMLEHLQALHVVLLNGIGEAGKSNLFEILPCQLRDITDACSFDNLLGETQFGKLYRGRISHGVNQNDARAVTVKIWDNSTWDSAYPTEKWSKLTEEVYFLQHPTVNCHRQNLAKPIAYSHKCEPLLIVYDLNSRDSLHNLILKDDFSWIQRIRVALQLARLLVHFHNYNPPFIVRNMCAAHFLVDQDYNPVMFDFGMLVGGFLGTSDIPDGKLHGAPGYIDLHYIINGGWSTMRDVFSFGVLLLNLFSKRVFDISKSETSAAHFAKQLGKQKISYFMLAENLSTLDEMFGRDPDYNFSDSYNITKIALCCMVYDPENRPTMKQVYESLQTLYVVQRTGMGDPSKSVLCEFLSDQLREYTGGYHKENFLGNTQFAKLYRGRILDDADGIHIVTVKIFDDSLCDVDQPPEEMCSKMMDEVYFLQHHTVNGYQQNFAKPIGYVYNFQRPGIVYDLNPRDTLHNEILKDNFKWLQRIKVALQLARLLLFFHNHNPPFIVCNISADHILVDQDYNPVLFDFGMMIGGLFCNMRGIPKQKLYGAPGHEDLSFCIDDRWCVERDVFSFGVVFLSLLAKRVCDPSRPKSCSGQWAKKNYTDLRTEKDVMSVFRRVHKIFKKDPGYNRYDARVFTRLAMACIEYSPKRRPTMKDVFGSMQFSEVAKGFSKELGMEDSLVLQADTGLNLCSDCSDCSS